MASIAFSAVHVRQYEVDDSWASNRLIVNLVLSKRKFSIIKYTKNIAGMLVVV